MPISFTAQQRKDVTRRQLNIVTENSGYAATASSFTSIQTMLQNVDNANIVLYNFYVTQATSYESEAQALNGTISAEYSDSDVTAAAQLAAGNIFFPTSPPWVYNNPAIIPQVNGYLNPTSTAYTYESDVSSGLSSLMSYVLAGAGSSVKTTSTDIPAGPASGLVLTLSSGGGFNINDVVLISNGPVSGVYQITNTMGTTVTVDSLIPASSDMPTSTVTNVLSDLQGAILDNVTLWGTYVTDQISALTSQNDTRAPESTQNTAALAADNSALTVINAWIASPSYTSGGLAPLQTLVATRTTFISTRIPQIMTALGSVIDNGNGTFSDGGTNSSYFNRYTWLNIRVNKVTGSLTRYYAASSGGTSVAGLIANNNSTLAQYNMYFTTSKLMGVDGTDILTCNTAGFSQGDNVTVVSESQPEIGYVASPPSTGTIVSILGPQSMKLSFAVPVTYQTTSAELARVFKQL